MAIEDDIDAAFGSLHELVDAARDELDPILARLFESLRGLDYEDADLYRTLVEAGLLLELGRVPLEGVLRRTVAILRLYGRDVSVEDVRQATLSERGQVSAYLQAEARAAFEQARARLVAGLNPGVADGDLIEQARDIFVNYMHNRMDAAVMLWQRLVVDVVARDVLKGQNWLWFYAGIRDDRNRPFCAAVIDANRVYDDAQVAQLNDHPLLAKYIPPNVRTLCGGFGCRHVFLPVSPSEAGDRYKPGVLPWHG